VREAATAAEMEEVAKVGLATVEGLEVVEKAAGSRVAGRCLGLSWPLATTNCGQYSLPDAQAVAHGVRKVEGADLGRPGSVFL